MRIDDDILRLDVAVHDALTVAVVQSLHDSGVYLEKFVEVVADLEVCHVGDQGSEINIVEMVENLAIFLQLPARWTSRQDPEPHPSTR